MIGAIIDIVGKFIPDGNKAKEAAVQLEKEYTKQLEMQSDIIKSEIKSGGITAKWRPYTMMAFVTMVVLHWVMYDVVPFIIVTFDINMYYPQDPGFTDGLLDLIKIGLGGYIGARTIEKAVGLWKK